MRRSSSGDKLSELSRLRVQLLPLQPAQVRRQCLDNGVCVRRCREGLELADGVVVFSFAVSAARISRNSRWWRQRQRHRRDRRGFF